MDRGRVSWSILMVVVGLGDAIESPPYSVVHSESKFEVRLYRESATRDGFHRSGSLLPLNYIQGANLNSSRVSMTAPVLTSIVPGAGPLDSSAYYVRFYLPLKFQATPPLPLPELNLEPYSWTSHCIAIRKFSGFARDGNVVEEAEKLAASLSRSPWAKATSKSINAYSIAQYNSPFRFIGRVNEVWVDVNGSGADGCGSSQRVAYWNSVEDAQTM